MPVFVLIHHAHPPVEMDGNTTFHFQPGLRGHPPYQRFRIVVVQVVRAGVPGRGAYRNRSSRFRSSWLAAASPQLGATPKTYRIHFQAHCGGNLTVLLRPEAKATSVGAA